MITWKLSDIQDIPKQAGIYQIKNVLNGHSYIGSTNNFYDRLMQHRSHLRKQKHHSIVLHRIGKGCKNVYCYNKDGEFIGYFLNSKQAVKLLNLNITPGTINKCCTGLCKSICGFIWSYDYKTDISYKKDNAKRTKIVRIYKDGIEKIYNSITEAAKDTGNINNKSAISDCLRGRRKTAYGSKWGYYND